MLAQALDSFWVRLSIRLAWRRDSLAVLESLRRFEATEDDSAWQLLEAARALGDPEARARLFEQSLEEAHHAEVFRRLYREMAGSPCEKLSVERKAIFRAGDEWKAFVYCFEGEASAARRFRSIREAIPQGPMEGPMRLSLDRIIEEESHHVDGALELLELCRRKPGEIRRALWSIRASRARESWLRAGRGLAGAVSRGLLRQTYRVFGILGGALFNGGLK